MESNLQQVKSIDKLDIKQHSTIVVTSKRATGKLVIIQNLCSILIREYSYQELIMFISTAHLQEEWNYIKNIYNDSELDQKLESLFEYQEKNINKKKSILLVLDDVDMQSNNISKLLSKFNSLCRHLFLPIIVSFQYPKYILNGLIRNNIDYLFFSELNQMALKVVYGMAFKNMNYKEFEKL